ncbi:NAD-dependent succinate-semialdehyde dehydrogenase [Shouchella lehensis]|uniref:NAD-dependent succinate-semialdehyde dehydrogenase n=1 Tax=Shouchella lehensis TaxID=300825 RepID=A0A4Y7WLT5_9BACI|nr:NAD-dependent succinate-semialdehyde dehydrogenase [Shouchella lehensis]MBG9783314.1 succinate-semialdehyde dehydrogenase [Shouchella lehensis]TES49307.1 NAD-dependent succinate-semialdehyde dehydrogenase [Shouchella lehensis]
MNRALFINNGDVWTNQTIEVENPATKEIIGTIAKAGREEAKQAVDAAASALKAWKNKTAAERSEYLLKWHELIRRDEKILGEGMTIEQGKPLTEAVGEIRYANSFLSWYAEEGKRIYGETVPASAPNKRILVQKQAIGVIAAITPWNFPAAMLTRKLGPALAAGCTAVVKPSELTPFTAYRLADLALEAGVPKGVINVITGDAAAIGEVWMNDDRVRKVSFTGSTAVGKLLMRQAADTVKKLSLELGGHAPFIVTQHADIEKAVDGLMASKYRNGGQTCVCANRVFVHESIKDLFSESFIQAVKQLKTGNGLADHSIIGPLVNQSAVDKVQNHLRDAQEKGATLIYGQEPEETNGYYQTPVVVMDATDDMLCMNEETFGPLAPITTYQSVDEVIQRANATPFGLAAYVYSTNLSEAFTISEALEYGIIGLNDGLPSVAQAPFGGVKESGLGREGGHWGIEEYLEVKYISMEL